MKFLKSISLFCFILIFGIGIYLGISYLYGSSRPIEEEAVPPTVEEPDLSVMTKQNVTTCDTVYEVETYIGNAYSHAIETIPFSFTGLNREELQKEIERYELSPTFTDLQKGFSSIELVSFHPEHIVVKKTYEQQQEKIIYYIKTVAHELVVFRSDQDSVFMPTDLTLDMLPENVQQEVIATKCFNSLNEVYDFLESYSS